MSTPQSDRLAAAIAGLRTPTPPSWNARPLASATEYRQVNRPAAAIVVGTCVELVVLGAEDPPLEGYVQEVTEGFYGVDWPASGTWSKPSTYNLSLLAESRRKR